MFFFSHEFMHSNRYTGIKSPLDMALKFKFPNVLHIFLLQSIWHWNNTNYGSCNQWSWAYLQHTSRSCKFINKIYSNFFIGVPRENHDIKRYNQCFVWFFINYDVVTLKHVSSLRAAQKNNYLLICCKTVKKVFMMILIIIFIYSLYSKSLKKDQARNIGIK